MRLPIQLQIIIFRKNQDTTEYLLLKRTEEKGGFWQGVSGGLESEENVMQGIKRELFEEIGINETKRIIDKFHFFQFEDKITSFFEKKVSDTEKIILSEYVFAVEINSNIIIDIDKNPCKEHTEYKWVEFDEAINLLYWQNNKDGFTKLKKILDEAK